MSEKTDQTSALPAADRKTALSALPDWRYDVGALHAVYACDTAAGALGLLAAIGEIAEQQQHHPDVDWRYRHVFVRSTSHDAGEDVTGRDIKLATAISAAADAAGAEAHPELARSYEVGIDTRDVGAVVGVWERVLGYQRHGEGYLADPWGRGPSVWFQETEQPADSRMHVDVIVHADAADSVLDEVVAAGGRRIEERFRPSWTVVADADGNRACICTNLGRD